MFACNFKRWCYTGVLFQRQKKKGKMNVEVHGLKLQSVCHVCLMLLKILEKIQLHSWDVLC